MIKIALEKASQEQLANARFVCSSFFNFSFSAGTYDVISGNGFIEYISFSELEQFLKLSHDGLRKGGSLVLGSRNRLFNALSLNDFTETEIQGGTISFLLRESMALVSGASVGQLLQVETPPFQRETIRQMDTGVHVSVRYQYTPAQLTKLLTAKGYCVTDLYPIHIHGVVPMFGNQNPQVHQGITSMLQVFAPKNPSLIPCASTFMICATRED